MARILLCKDRKFDKKVYYIHFQRYRIIPRGLFFMARPV